MPPTTLYPRLMIARHLEFESKTRRAIYSLGIFGSCFWKSVFSPVKMTEERDSRSFSTATIRIIPFRNSTYAAFSCFPEGCLVVSCQMPDSKLLARPARTAAEAGPAASTVTPVTSRDS